MNVLSIGNSFSQDAQRYLHGIARAAGEKIANVNLYIGGCSLERHHQNMCENMRAYTLECGGIDTGFRAFETAFNLEAVNARGYHLRHAVEGA